MAFVRFFLIYFTLFMVTKGEDIVVNTKSGPVAGKKVKSIIQNVEYFSFLGIPYAEPPIGELRFMPPKPHEGWTEVRDCTKERQACAQNYLPTRHYPRYGVFGDEDCLHLSVHTPQLPSNRESDFPVLLFIYNDHFRMSYNGTKDFTPDFFMEQGVIVVSVNHRFGSLGFLSYEDDLLPGNNGLRDIILALKWLKDNIHNFGGNSKKITLLGSQAGAAIVDILLNSPKAKGLFHGAILQSGTSWSSMYFNKAQGARKRANDLSEQLKIPSSNSKDLLSNLRSVSSFDLLEAELRAVHADDSRAVQRGTPGFPPIIEHDHQEAVIAKLPDENTLDIDVPVMIGYNSREGIELGERYLRKPQYLTFADRDFLFLFPIRTDYHFKISDNIYYKAVEDIKEFYFDEGYVKVSRPGEYLTYIADVMQFYSVDYTVRKYAKESKSPVYYYTFDYDGDLNARKKANLKDAMNYDGTWGATITDELCYLFVCNNIRKSYVKALKQDNSEEIQVLRNMVKLWTNFIKTGNPTPVNGNIEDFVWKPASEDKKECLLINDELQMKTNLHQDRVDFWDGFIEKYRQQASDGVVKDLKTEL